MNLRLIGFGKTHSKLRVNQLKAKHDFIIHAADKMSSVEIKIFRVAAQSCGFFKMEFIQQQRPLRMAG